MDAPAMRSELGGGWVPEAAGLEHIVKLLEASLNPQIANERHQEIAREVDGLSTQGEFARYLAFVVAEAQKLGASEQLRYMGSLVLVKATRIGLQNGALSPDGLQHVRRSALRVMSDPNALLRKSASSLISTIVTFTKLADWPDLLEFLRAALEQTQDEIAFAGALDVFEHLCEDCGPQLSEPGPALGPAPLDYFFPILMHNFQNPKPKYRAQATKCVNLLMMMSELPPVVSAFAEDVLQGLSLLSQDKEDRVKKQVCAGLTYLLYWRVDVVVPHFGSIVSFMLQMIADPDSSVAHEAIEFVFQLCDDPKVAEAALLPHLGSLFPLLLKRLEYSEEELQMLGTDEENDTSVPDRETDIRPSHHGGIGTRGGKLANAAGGTAGDDDDVDEDDDDDDDDEDGGEEEDYFSVWTVRKAAGRALDAISQTVPAERALPVLLPLIQQNLELTRPWLAREAAVLALGSFASGYASDLEEHLPTLVPFLLEQAQVSESYIRMAALWAIGRYCAWICETEGSGRPGDGLFKQTVVVATKSTMDRNKRVQHGACSCLSNLAAGGRALLDPYCEEVCGVLMQAYAMYQLNNRKWLLDTLGELFASAPAGMSQPQVFSRVFPPLWADFEALSESDPLVMHFFETFGVIVKEIGTGFGDYCKPLYDRAISLTEGTLMMVMGADQMGLASEDIDREYMFASLELISSLTEGLKDQVSRLIDFPTFLPLLQELLKDDDDVTRETVYALCGDLAAATPREFAPLMPHVLQVLERVVYPPDDAVGLVNNAVWAIGKFAATMQGALPERSPGVVNKLVLLLCMDSAEDTLRLNAAVSLSRIAMWAPQVVGQHLDSCLAAWASTARRSYGDAEVDEEERADLVKGLFAAVMANPGGVGGELGYLCLLVTTVYEASPEPDTLRACQNMLAAVRQALVASGLWATAFGALNVSLVKELELRQLLPPSL